MTTIFPRIPSKSSPQTKSTPGVVRSLMSVTTTSLVLRTSTHPLFLRLTAPSIRNRLTPQRSFTSTPIARMATDDSCIFCKIIKGDIPSFKLAESDKLLAFLDIQPLSQGHAVCSPHCHTSYPASSPLVHTGRIPQVPKARLANTSLYSSS